jgi:phage repressor protein C with HTH and peptisase S24 domain
MPRAEHDTAPIALRRLLDRSGLTQEQLARACGFRFASGIQRYLTPDSYKQPYFRPELVRKIAAALVGKGQPAITPSEIWKQLAGIVPQDAGNDAELPSNVSPAPDLPIISSVDLDRDIEVHGTAVGGNGGDFRFNGDVVDRIRRPPGIVTRGQNVFAIYAQGESMVPWRRPGDPVYLDKVKPPRPGEHVVVELHGRDGEPGDAYLKLLVAMTPTKVRLKQYNPERDDIFIAQARVKHIYRVIDWPELLGV